MRASFVGWMRTGSGTVVMVCEAMDDRDRRIFMIVSANSSSQAKRLLKGAGVHGLKENRSQFEPEPWQVELAEETPCVVRVVEG